MPAPVLAVISKTRMVARIESVIEQLRSLHGMAVDKSARQNLKCAILSTQTAVRVYEHHNLQVPGAPLERRRPARPIESNVSAAHVIADGVNRG